MPTVQIEGVGRVQFPEGMTPEQITAAIEADILPKQQPAQGDLSRSISLSGRAAAEGVASVATTPADFVMNSAQMTQHVVPVAKVFKLLQDVTGKTPTQLLVSGFNKAFGTEIPEAETFQGLLEEGITEAGAPTPETSSEKLGYQAVKGAAAGVTGAGAAGLARPVMAAVSGASGGASAEFVKQKGGGPGAQLTAGIVGGMAPYAGVEGAKAVVRGGRALLEPFSQAGREKIVGRTLTDVASDPKTAEANMAVAQELVPGSKPTAAEVSKDYGIISTQRAAKATNPAQFAQRSSEQNTARQNFISVAAKDETAVKNLVERRDQVTTKLRDTAFQQAKGKTVNASGVAQKLDDMLADPDNAGETTQKALQWAKSQVEGKTDPRALYAVRKDISMKLAGQVSSEESVLRYAGKELGRVRDIIDDAIQDIAPAWKQYLIKYRQLSKPIDRMSSLQEAQSKASYAPSDALTGREVLTQAKWKSQVRRLAEDGKLTKGQTARIERVAEDLDRGMAVNDPNIRAIGSNTTQDLTAANVLGQAIGSTKMSPFVRSIARPLQWVYKIPEAELQKGLTEALLDPKLAAALMRKASGSQMAVISKMLREKFAAASIGTGAAAASRQSQEQGSTEEQEQ